MYVNCSPTMPSKTKQRPMRANNSINPTRDLLSQIIALTSDKGKAKLNQRAFTRGEDQCDRTSSTQFRKLRHLIAASFWSHLFLRREHSRSPCSRYRHK